MNRFGYTTLKILFVLGIFNILLPQVNAESDEQIRFVEHIVRPGEQLGKILQDKNLSPLWGPNGYVAKTIALNPRLFKLNGDFLNPTRTILVPISAKTERKIAQEQTTEKKSEISSKAENADSLEISSLISVSRVSAINPQNNNRAVVYSKFNPGLHAIWKSDWSSGWSNLFDLKFLRRSFEGTKDSKLKLDSFSMGELGVGVEKKLSPKIFSKLILGVAHQLYLISTDANTVSFDKTLVPKATFETKLNLFESQDSKKKLYFAPKLSYFSPMPTQNYRVKGGLSEFGFNFWVQKKLGLGLLECGFFGNYRKENTTIFNQSSVEGGLKAGFQFEF